MTDMHSTAQDALQKSKPLAPKINELLQQSRSVILATVDADGTPNASYAPFARIGNQFYILVSFMARHTKNLRDIGKVSAMFIEDEASTKQIYARDRLTLEVNSRQVDKETEEGQIALALLKEAHGKVLDMLTAMDDFILVRLSPVKGAYVNGFGSAYFVDEQLEVIQHRNDAAHSVRSTNN